MAKINGINVAQLKSRGTGSADTAFSVLPPTGTSPLFRVSGDGGTTISGSLVASSITGSLLGNASTATLATTANATTAALTAGAFLTSGGTFNGSTARTFAVDATNANIVSKVVARDASGNFSAGTITAALSGNASSATILQTARTINGTSFNGSADITTANWGTTRNITIGNTGKSVNGSGNVAWSLAEIQAEYEVPINTLRNNLGSPTVREAALFHGQFNNKFRFLAPTLQEESENGTTWVTSTRASTAVLGDMMIGEGQSTNFNAIPSAAIGTYGGYRLTWNVVNSTGYVFLNALYIYNSTNGNAVNITIEAFHNTNGWVTITGPHLTSNWPGHTYIPHSTITYSNNASQYSQVRVTFTTTHNSNTNAFSISSIEWWGGYPQGRRNVESYDRDRNVYFPSSIVATSNLQGSRLISTIATGTAPLAVTSTTRVANLNVAAAGTADILTTARTINGVSFNGSANITVADSTKLPLAGGTMTGDITFTAGQTWPTFNQNTTGNASTATTWQTGRTITIGNTGKSVNGSGNVAWSLAEIGAQAVLTNPVTGTGTTNYIPKFTGASTVGSSIMVDTGFKIGIGTASPRSTLDVAGAIYAAENWNSFGYFLGNMTTGET
jgi:hypothetical protein